MSKHPSGTVTWARDPTEAHPDRPVIVLSHEDRPFSGIECTVVCLGTAADTYDHPTLAIENQHLIGLTFSNPTYLLPHPF